jgi:hypothetical protein
VSIFLFREIPHGRGCECGECRSSLLPDETEAPSPDTGATEDMGEDPPARLLRGLHRVGRMVEPPRPPAQERLRDAVGDTLTDLLLPALRRDRTQRPKQDSQQETA